MPKVKDKERNLKGSKKTTSYIQGNIDKTDISEDWEKSADFLAEPAGQKGVAWYV